MNSTNKPIPKEIYILSSGILKFVESMEKKHIEKKGEIHNENKR